MRELRESQNKTVASVAKAAGIPHSWQLSKIELDGILPDPERLQAIADELQTTIVYLMTGKGERMAIAPSAAVGLDEWLAMLPHGAPHLALAMARNAWELAGGASDQPVSAKRALDTPMLTPPARSSSQSLVPSGMRAKKGARKSEAPPAVKRRAR